MTKKAPAKKAKQKPQPAKAKSKSNTPINYADMDLESLQQAAEELHVATAEKILDESEALRTAYYAAVQAIDRAMAKHGITAQEFLTLPKAKLRKAIVSHLRGEARQTLAPRFQHPQHPDLTWTGRGSRPRWLRDLLDKGHDLEEFRVQR
jgi:DNA-binding protein H-NS